ncbi:GerA spore germination protein [Ureibacillus chungkukjangi]|uniref:GerA spore germination protein n=1 Tax=Ureibacillus chungkukjangi TaxID=1202712 RepID=A0A318TS42_9BACL|nr:GerA spore germination protein [Ureibacillus chungkukjangi]
MSPFFKKRTKSEQPTETVTIPDSEILKDKEGERVSSDLEENIEGFNKIFKNDIDFLIRRFALFGTQPAALLCLKTLVGKEDIERDIVKPLQESNYPIDQSMNEIDYILNNVLYYSDVKTITDSAELIQSLTLGKAVIFVDGIEKSLELDAKKPEKRAIEQPETERVVRGARDGFIEQIGTNVALLRYRLPVPEFRIESTEVGTRTRTKVVVCYMEDIVNENLLVEVKKRIDAIKMDGILDAG